MTSIHPLVSILGLTIGSSLLGLAGGFFLLWREASTRRWATLLMSFGAGAILGATFLELLPEALTNSADAGHTLLFMLGGVVLFFIVERLLIWHHHTHEHDTGEDTHHPTHLSATTVRPLIIIGDALHNFLDGAVIAIAFLVSAKLGVVTALAILVHELPQEIGDFSILIHSGMRKGSVALWNVLGALVSPLGALVAFIADERFKSLEVPLLAFAAGNFLYIALADLVPAMQHQRSFRQSIGQILMLLLGLGIIWGIGLVLPEA